jgi:hypothetical protein
MNKSTSVTNLGRSSETSQKIHVATNTFRTSVRNDNPPNFTAKNGMRNEKK